MKFIDLPNVQYYSLQVGPNSEDIKALGFEEKIIDLTPQIKSFLDTAQFIEQLDLVISIDTAVVHLAGALNKPAWNLLHFNADWRWLENGAEKDISSWYPTMKLFRQEQSYDWSIPLAKVAKELKLLIKGMN